MDRSWRSKTAWMFRPYGWRSGDVIAQIQHIDLPPDVQRSNLAIGLYRPDTNARLPVTVDGQPIGDQVLLSEVQP